MGGGEHVEIRPVTAGEAVEYLRVMPYYNGMPQWEPAPSAGYTGEAAWAPRSGFSEQALRTAAEDLLGDDFHPQAAFIDGRIVGGSAMLSLQITVPGPRIVALSGVTDTAVIATHRRRGLLRAVMQAMFDEALARGDAVAGLSASEGGIYGRFGFGPATMRTRWEIERAAVRWREPAPVTGSLELADAAVARVAWPALHEQARRTRVGEVSAHRGLWQGISDVPVGTDGPMRFVVHRDVAGQIDGAAQFRLPWAPRAQDTGALRVESLEALNADAYRDLWGLLLDFDLTRRIVAAPRPLDEPLRWLLADPRALRVTRQSDNLWIRLLDLPAALSARGYHSDDAVTVAIESDSMCPGNAGTWRLEASQGTGSCDRVVSAPDLTIDIEALGSLYLGGGSAALLAAAGRVREHRNGAVARLSRLLTTDPAPYNAIGF
ncbi:MAG: GNAT family N-acetyltransferase [Solirubrobacteraceae bacterium]